MLQIQKAITRAAFRFLSDLSGCGSFRALTIISSLPDNSKIVVLSKPSGVEFKSKIIDPAIQGSYESC